MRRLFRAPPSLPPSLPTHERSRAARAQLAGGKVSHKPRNGFPQSAQVSLQPISGDYDGGGKTLGCYLAKVGFSTSERQVGGLCRVR